MKLILDLGNLWDMLSALGTIGAVVLSLWLARRTGKPNLYIYYCMDDDSETDLVNRLSLMAYWNGLTMKRICRHIIPAPCDLAKAST